ncbi:MAG: hypothetical protein ED557_12135 [Balneola sp.]|nr:MAG: hypothetical protein ED557_12135 [Balneola sp.]
MKLIIGDIFEFHIGKGNLAYGQIIKIPEKKAYTIVIFEKLYKVRPSIDKIIKDKILLFGNTFDAKFYHKHWQVIANNSSNISDIQIPFYKIGTEPVYIENFDGVVIREALEHEEEILTYREFVAPVRFESAIKAYYNKSDWDIKYNSLLYSNIQYANNRIDL